MFFWKKELTEKNWIDDIIQNWNNLSQEQKSKYASLGFPDSLRGKVFCITLIALETSN